MRGQPGNFSAIESVAALYPNGLEPEFCNVVVALNMDMRGFVPVPEPVVMQVALFIEILSRESRVVFKLQRLLVRVFVGQAHA